MIRFLTIASIGGALTSAACIGLIAAKNREETGLRDTIAGFVACDTAVTNSDLTVSAARCSDAVAAVHLTARRAERCDTALDTSDAFTIDAACSRPAKQVVAERDARTRERDAAQSQLTDTRRGQAVAIASAEARGRTQTQRTERAETDLAAAPRTDAGLGRCDADCLRRLADTAPR